MTINQISIAATFTAEPLVHALEFWLRQFDYRATIRFAPYNQVLQSLVDPNSILLRRSSGLNVLLIRIADWVSQSSTEDFAQRIEERSQECLVAVQSFSQQSASQALICFCPTDFGRQPNTETAVQAAEQKIVSQLAAVPGISVVTNQELESSYPTDAKFDPVADRTGHVPFTQAFYAGLGTLIARKIFGLQKRPVKLIAVDCDNTLWSGVSGEFGATGVVIEPGHKIFQQKLVDLRAKGTLLALCSKNTEQDVWSVFEHNDAMVLRREHFSAVEINWHEKSRGLKNLARRLGLGLDSILFLDDNPLELAEVRANCPSVLTMQIPSSNDMRAFLQHAWPLDNCSSLSSTDADQLRAVSYQDEMLRDAERKNHVSMRSFLENLELDLQILDITEENLSRAAQLIERTNQFNLTLKRRSVAELRQVLASNSTSAFLVDVSDKFGNYGIVGIAILQQLGEQFHVDTFALSCRALGRGVEYQILQHIGRLAKEAGLSSVSIRFVAGERNEPAARFLRFLNARLGEVDSRTDEYWYTPDQLLAVDPLEFSETEENDASSQDTPTEVSEAREAPSELLNQIAHEFNTVERILLRLERETLPRPELLDPSVAPTSELENRIAKICCGLLRIDCIGIEDSLARLGASSLQLVQIHSQLVQRLGLDLSITELYNLPTIAAISHHHLRKNLTNNDTAHSSQVEPRKQSHLERQSGGIAIIGMAGRFPGADSVAELWQNLLNEVNSIVPLSEDELNLPPDSPLRTNPNLVRKSAAVRDADQFDAKFFGIFPKEAKVMDPQHRLMLECCWTALEDAGYCPDKIEQSVGVFAGCYMDTYILASLESNPELINSLANSFHGGDLHTELGNDKDYLATRVSFLLNLRGPSMTVQTACSTSLVAIIQACQALQYGHCEMALAGGATLKFPQGRGYLYTEGGMVSPDGICRPFDADARGTVFGEGVGAVLLKRLDQAISDGDEVYGVIRGWGINNDGRSKMAYTAPSVKGQTSAIEMAHRQAGFSADSITYVEAHGTGTSLGDPIEVDALTRAFRKTTDNKQYCGIGSVKSNIGHLDVAAGVTGLIKICQAMRHQTIPASLNLRSPNPNIDFANSPFYVVTKAQPWRSNGKPRRAGLSSFGVGGTNAHIVIEEPPTLEAKSSEPRDELLVLSARSTEALDKVTSELAEYLDQQGNLRLADVAHTLQVGRKEFVHKRVLVAKDITEATTLLRSYQNNPLAVFTQNQARRRTRIDFVFPGQGSQHPNMAAGLYQQDPVFREYFDECVRILKPHLGFDLGEKVFVPQSEVAAEEMNQTGVAQPAIFSVSYALAKRLEHFGIVPQRMVGHSVGEFVAACVAGVFSLENALRLISFRATNMQVLQPGSMVAVRIREDQLRPFLTDTSVEIAAINSLDLCVISGPHSAISKVQGKLEQAEFVCRSLHTSHAFHSQMMEPVIEPFAKQFADVKLSPPSIPIISSVTGRMLTDEQATDPVYWSRHLRETVRFSDAVGVLLGDSENVVLEVGPGQALSTLVRQHPNVSGDRSVFSILPHAKVAANPYRHWLLTLGRLWQVGGSIGWQKMPDATDRKRVHLPTYPFERQRYWFDEKDCNVVTINDRPPQQQTLNGSFESHPDDPRHQIDQSRLGISEIQDLGQPSPATAAVAPPIAEQVIRQQLQLMQQQLELWRR